MGLNWKNLIYYDLEILILKENFTQSIFDEILEFSSWFNEIETIYSFHHVTYSCVLHVLLDFEVTPRHLLCSCILNSNSIAANGIIPFATTSSWSHNTPTQNSLESIMTSIFTCNKISWFQSLHQLEHQLILHHLKQSCQQYNQVISLSGVATSDGSTRISFLGYNFGSFTQLI